LCRGWRLKPIFSKRIGNRLPDMTITIDLTTGWKRTVSSVATEDGFRRVTVGSDGTKIELLMTEEDADHLAGQMLDRATGGD